MKSPTNLSIVRLSTKVLVSLISIFTIVLSLLHPATSVQAAATLTIAPLTWNVVGLDSNNVNVGPNNFPVGARVCNTGDTPAINVTSTFVWDSSDLYIYLRPESLTSFSDLTALASLAPNTCQDFYYEVQITRNSAAYDHTRRYHITAASTETSPVSTTTQGEIYVEHLISQHRNSVTDVKLNNVSIPSGGTMSLLVGNTYNLQLVGRTSTNGFNELESFINLSNTIFHINSVNSTYSVTSLLPPHDYFYADSCGWDNNPLSPTYRSCIGSNGKTGGIVTTTYNITIIGGGGSTQTLNTLLYDFSGSSYHYNSDFSTSARFVSIVNPTNFSKVFSPASIITGGTSTLTFKVSNTTASPLNGVSFSDNLPSTPAQMVVAGTPGLTTSGCGYPTVSAAAGSTVISLTNASIAAGGTCAFSVNVTVPSNGTYANTSDNLTINGVDTGQAASATLTVLASPTLTKQFSPNSIYTGQTTTLHFTLTNPNNVALTAAAFTDPLPAGIQVAATPAATTTCADATFSPAAGATSLSFSGGTIPAKGSCTAQVNVTAASTGNYANTTSTLTTAVTGLTGNAASDTLAVIELHSGLELSKQVSSSPSGPWSSSITGVTPGSSVYYKFIVINSGIIPLSGLSINDALVNTSACELIDPLAPGAATACVVGPVTTQSGLHTNVATAQSTTPTVASPPSEATYIAGGYSIAGTVWEDINADGIISGGEPRLFNVTLALYLDNGNGTFNTAEDTFLGNHYTTADGSYGFSELPAGTYFVRVTAGVDGYVLVSGGSNPRLITLTSSDSSDNNFGYRLPQADLAVTKTDGVTAVNPNGSTTYTIRVTNNGPDSVTGATLVDTVGLGLTATGVACSGAPSNQCVSSSLLANLTSTGISLPALSSGQFYEISLTASVTAVSGSVTNIASVSLPSGTTDPTPDNNTATDTDTLNLYHVYLPGVSNQVSEVKTTWNVMIGYEDLSLITGQNDFDYNDWTVAIDGTLTFRSASSDLLQNFTLSFVPRARGGFYDHTFQIRITAQAFASNGTAVVNLYDQNHNLISRQVKPFSSSTDNTFVIFAKTSEVFPGSVINTVEGVPWSAPQRYADLTITFDTPVPFSFNSNDIIHPHGEGLFFDPTLLVINNGEQIHRGDVRLLSIPSGAWLWPEESTQIDRAYPLVVFKSSNPPDFSFPSSWWTVHNHCVYDGVSCGTP